MNFSNPSFLYGLFALSIPIIVHLFNFRKAKKVYFSNTRFLQDIKETSSAKRRLKHYLVLLSRLLFIFFLVMAFAQPILEATEKGLNNKNVSIYLDNSRSMENMSATGIRAFDEALSYVQEILKFYPRGTQFRLITNQFAPFSNSYKSADKVEDYTTELSLNGVDRTLMEIEDRRNALNAAINGANEDVYIISDFQESTLGAQEEWKLDTTDNFHFIPIAIENSQNISIDSIYLKTPFVLDKNNVSFTAVVRNFGNEKANNVGLKVFIENIQLSSTTVSLNANSSQEIEFDIAFDLQNENMVRIVVDDYSIAFDNEFYFVISTDNKLDILEINPNGQSTPISKVFGNERLFQTTVQSISNVDYSRISTSNLVVLNQIESLTTSLATAIKNYLADNGRLLIVPPTSGNMQAYNGLMAGLKMNATANPMMNSLEKPDLNNPFFADIFEENKSVFNMPQATNTIGWQGKTEAILSFNLGNPFLSLYQNSGIAYILASPLVDAFTDFHKHALFVPTMYKIATYNTKNASRLYYLLNETMVSERLDSVVSDNVFVIKQDENEVIPEQRMVGNELLLQLPSEYLTSGFSALQLKGEHKKWLAFNYDQKESDVRQIGQEALQNFADQHKNVTLFASSDANTFSKEIKARYLGQPLWKFAILLALFFLLMEILIIRYMK